jgi:hypothetical protein
VTPGRLVAHLVELLGIDPAAETMALQRRILAGA